MFDIGFLELLLVVLVGLVVVGPDKLPQAVKSIIKSFRKVKTYLNQTLLELEKSVGMDEIRQDLHNENITQSLKEDQEAKSDSDK
mgnify:FL=1|tara:strand:+ start:288 stop:542 length:255 start_codon:yes stop_codon:yes gene_type:complete